MSLSSESVRTLAIALSGDFEQFIAENYDAQLSELLASAATEFIAQEMGELSPTLENDLAFELVKDGTITLLPF